LLKCSSPRALDALLTLAPPSTSISIARAIHVVPPPSIPSSFIRLPIARARASARVEQSQSFARGNDRGRSVGRSSVAVGRRAFEIAYNA
jgi:hypothetical protein